MSPLTFAHPVLLLGLALALVPILIHFLLRPRPRRTRFPALALLREVVVSGQRAHRLRDILLMLVRAAMLGLLALLLAGPTCATPGMGFIGTDPLACAVVLDDSVSTHYQLRPGQRVLDLSVRSAAELIEGSRAWAPGSVLALVSGSALEPPPVLIADRALLLEQLESREARPPHATPLGASLRAAADLLRSADQPVLRLVVFTDGAASAWRDVAPDTLAGLDRLAVRVVVPEEHAATNLALAAAVGPNRLYPATAPIPLTAEISAFGVESECWLVFGPDTEQPDRLGPVHVTPAGAPGLTHELERRPPGAHGLTVALEPDDRLAFDQRRFVAVQTAPQGRVWLIAAEQTAGANGDLTPLLMRNLLAPAVLPPETQRVALRVMDASELPTSDDASPGDPADAPVLVVLLSDVRLSEGQAARLRETVQRGATLLLVPGAAATDVAWPHVRALVCAELPIAETLDDPVSMRWEPESRFAGVEGLRELARASVRRRLRLPSLADGVVVHVRYTDNEPAVVEQRLGAGRVLLLGTSPDPRWSELGRRAAGLLTWLHRLIDETRGAPGLVAEFEQGSAATHRFSGLPAGGLMRVVPETIDQAEAVWLRVVDGQPQPGWPTERAGIYRIETGTDGGPVARYAVNWSLDESDTTPITLAALRRRLGTEHVQLAYGAPGARPITETPGSWGFAATDIRRLVAGLLLALFLLELAMLARGRPASPAH